MREEKELKNHFFRLRPLSFLPLMHPMTDKSHNTDKWHGRGSPLNMRVKKEMTDDTAGLASQTVHIIVGLISRLLQDV